VDFEHSSVVDWKENFAQYSVGIVDCEEKTFPIVDWKENFAHFPDIHYSIGIVDWEKTFPFVGWKENFALLPDIHYSVGIVELHYSADNLPVQNSSGWEGPEDIHQTPVDSFDCFDIASDCEACWLVVVVDALYSVDRVIHQQKVVFVGIAVVAGVAVVVVTAVEQELIFVALMIKHALIYPAEADTSLGLGPTILLVSTKFFTETRDLFFPARRFNTRYRAFPTLDRS
jgi:hypothetical protein